MSVDALRAGTIVVNQRDVEFRGERHSKDALGNRVRKVCPLCLRTDGDASNLRHRLSWCFRAIRRCSKHRVFLIGTVDPKARDVRDVAAGIVDAVPTDSGVPPAFSSWIGDRLRRKDDRTSWLGGQSIDQVVTASTMIGAVLEHGHKVRPGQLDDADRETVTEIGFSIFREGPEAVLAAFTRICRASPATAVQVGPLAMYGTLFDWLDCRSNHLDPGPVRSLLRDHIVEHSAVDVAEVVLGKEISERRFHSIATLVKRTGIGRRRLSRLLQKIGRFPDGARDAENGLLMFPGKEMEAICNDLSDTVLLHDVACYISASRSQAETVYRAGILRPVFPADGPDRVRGIVFARRHLNDFLAQLAALPQLDPERASEFKSVAATCQLGAGGTADVVAWILSGVQTASRREDPIGLDRTMVPLERSRSDRPAEKPVATGNVSQPRRFDSGPLRRAFCSG